MKRTFGVLAIIGSIAYLGNIINIGFTYAIAWQRLDPIVFMQEFETTFLLLLPTVAVTLLPGLIGIIVTITSSKENKAAQKSWKMALYATLISILITSVYHLPTNLAFMDQSYSASEAASKLQLWVTLHWVRIVLAIAASLFTIQGFQKNIESGLQYSQS
ncbi:MAG: anthrone oxygenase family protein [Cytophagales bacterium]|nr:anthrone oxygenase family protein [Cytophagales bacterium]